MNLAQPKRNVTCPGCGELCFYVTANPFRPFCSARCKGLDLGAWASESFRVAATAPAEDQEPDTQPQPSNRAD